MLQGAPKHVIFILKIQKFSGEGGGRLDLCAFGAHSRTPTRKFGYGPDNNNNNNKHDNVYGAVIMAEPLREFTRFI